MQKITPFLWFDNNAEEAMRFYTSVFPQSKVGAITRYADAGKGPKGSVMTATFELLGQTFIVLNGGPHFKFSQAVSFSIACEDQKEVDTYWEKLTAGGQKLPCGWLIDKFGLSWQVVPKALGELMGDKDPLKVGRAVQAIMKMTKIDIAALHKAFDGTT